MSAPSIELLPSPTVPEIALAGRSNVGKSSLLNALTGRRDLARTSTTPGRTQQINVFDIGSPVTLRLVDLPGYGFAAAPKAVVRQWRSLVGEYLASRPNLRRVLLLVDGRHGLKPVDKEALALMDQAGVSYQLVLTKADKTKPSELAAVEGKVASEIRQNAAARPAVAITSATTRVGIDILRSAMVDAIS